MKKIIVFTSVLLVLSITSVIYVCGSVNDEAGNVRYDIVDLYGNRSAAYGAQINVNYEHAGNMFWETNILIDKEDTVISEFNFRYSNRQQGEIHYSGITPYSSMHYSLNRNDPNATGLNKAYKEIYDSTPFGTEKTVTVKIADYYEYYPVSVTIHIPGFSYRSFDTVNDSGYQSVASKEITKTFNEFFKIPVSDKDTIDITVDRDESDGMSSNTIHTNFYNLASDSVLGKKTCYIYIANSNNDNSIADTSLIPGGYGIYAIEYGSEYEYGIDLTSLRTVFPLPENESVRKICLNEDRSLMYVFTSTKTNGYVYTIDTNSFTLLEKLKTEIPIYYHITVGDGFFLLYGDENIEVIAIESSGLCRSALCVKSAYHVDNTFHDLFVSASADFYGDKLVCVDHLHEGRFRSLELCSFYVSVYDKSGLIYYGEYNCSLSANPNSASYSYNCLPSNIDYIDVKWLKSK